MCRSLLGVTSVRYTYVAYALSEIGRHGRVRRSRTGVPSLRETYVTHTLSKVKF